jgi:hypothetical protein
MRNILPKYGEKNCRLRGRNCFAMPVVLNIKNFWCRLVAALSCKNSIIFVLAFALLGANALHLPAQELPPDFVKRIKQAVVTIKTFDQNGANLKNGSGFFIGAHQIITCEHTLKRADSIEIKLTNGRFHPVLRQPPESFGADLVLLEVEMAEVQVEPLTFAETLPL